MSKGSAADWADCKMDERIDSQDIQSERRRNSGRTCIKGSHPPAGFCAAAFVSGQTGAIHQRSNIQELEDGVLG